MAIVTTPAVLLRSHPYGETSRVLRFLTSEHGVVGAMAKGVRRDVPRRGSSLETFADGTLILHFRESRELQSFRDFSARRVRSGLGRSLLRLSGASFLSELILVHTAEEGSPELFEGFIAALDEIESGEEVTLPPRILAAAWRVVGSLGYRPSLACCVACERVLDPEELARFDFGSGGLRCSGCSEGRGLPRIGPDARRDLGALVRGHAPDHLRGAPAHLRILSGFVEYHLAGSRPLRTLPLLAVHFRTDDA